MRRMIYGMDDKVKAEFMLLVTQMLYSLVYDTNSDFAVENYHKRIIDLQKKLYEIIKD